MRLNCIEILEIVVHFITAIVRIGVVINLKWLLSFRVNLWFN